MSYLSTVLADNPLHYWRLADPGGFIGHDIGSTPWHMQAGQFAFGQYSGIALDGGAFYMQSNSGLTTVEAQALSSPYTLEVWCWPHSLTPLNEMLLAHDGVTATQNTYLALGSSSQFFLQVGGTSIVDPPVRSRQRWYHVVGTWDGVTARIYVNAVQGAATAVSGSFTTPHAFCLGETINNTLGLNGCLCEAAVYGTVLSPTRINAHFLAQEVSSAPVIRPAGTILNAAGQNVGDSSVIMAEILASVQRTFPTT